MDPPTTDNDHDGSTPPSGGRSAEGPPAGQLSSMNAGSCYTCGARADGTAAPWGSNEDRDGSALWSGHADDGEHNRLAETVASEDPDLSGHSIRPITLAC